MRVSLTSLLVALCLLAACGGGSQPPARAVDTECVQGVPFADRVTDIEQRDEARLAELSHGLAAAHATSDDQALLVGVAQVLAQEEADLRAAPAPGDDAQLVAALVSADEAMRSTAAEMATEGPDGMAARQAALTSAAQARAQAAQALQLRAEFVGGECGTG